MRVRLVPRKKALPFGRWRASNGRPFAWKRYERQNCRRKKEVLHMANQDSDESVLGHIDGLVKEEEQLYGKGELTDADQQRLWFPWNR